MCDSIEYFLDEERYVAQFGEPGIQLPIRSRGGRIDFYRWGAVGPDYITLDNRPGWAAKFPETNCAPLCEVRAGTWNRMAPQPVRIVAARFCLVDSWQVEHWYSLGPGEFIQGLLAKLGPERRVYVVTTDAPAEQADFFSEGWPRIVSIRSRNPVPSQAA